MALENATDEKDKRKLNEALEKIPKEPTNLNHAGESRSLYGINEDLMLGVFNVRKVIRVKR